MARLIFFIIIAIILIILSWKSLFAFRHHGPYRFVSWICIAWLFASNYPFWFYKPTKPNQLVSWFFLIISTWLVIAGILELRKAKRDSASRNSKALYRFEQTTELVTNGIYRYIRHPMYASLLFLT